MFKRYLLFLVFIIPGCLPLFARPQVEVSGFYMRNFYVSIDESSVRKNNMSISERWWRDTRSPFKDYRGVFSGKGSILIHSKKVPITFKDVKISKPPQGDVFKAVSGVVNGKQVLSLGRNQIKYNQNGFEVKIKISSINIKVKSATAAVIVSLHSPTFYTTTVNSLILKSDSCNIQPSGAIEGGNFHGSTAFDLKDSVYQLKLKQSDDQFVRLGSLLLGRRVIPGRISQITPKPLVEIKGFASRDNIELFSFVGSIKPQQELAAFSLNLLGPMVKLPEPGYVLYLHSGEVEYRYNKDGLQLCEGSFQANLQLPNTILNEDNTEIELENIILKTDQTGALFNNVNVPKKIKTGYSSIGQQNSNIFIIEPKKECSWVYFPVWHGDTQNSSYNYKVRTCERLYEFLDPSGGATSNDELNLNAHKRPGLTIFQGILYFKAPQVTFRMDAPVSPYNLKTPYFKAPQVTFRRDAPVSPYNLKTPFWGALTCTPWGITGELTSSGYSFVPSNRSIDESSGPVDAKQCTWPEIIDLGNTRPPEPKERFSLAGFRILDMHADSLRICKNELDDSSFRYTIHFPFPSFIDLEFEDKTLDTLGKFRTAYGPIAPFSYEFTQQPSSFEMERLPEEAPKYAEVTYNPVSQILFAWRLPVAFSHRGVVIEYKNPPLDSEAKVLMTVNTDDEKIVGGELEIVPLYSLESDLKFGIRFKGKFSTGGNFTLLDWDKEPFFSKIYPTPGREKTMGFATRKINIVLAESVSNPVSREFDFRWDGEIQFPFFSWQSSDFIIKDLVPKKQLPVSLSGVGSGCNGVGLELKIDQLEYTHEQLTPFRSENIEAYEIDNENRRMLKGILLNISSYLNGFVILENTPTTVIINDNTTLIDAVSSDNIKDLVCYDPVALATRQSYNMPGSCCEQYYIGTCQVKTSQGKLIMSAPNTKYYPGVDPIKLVLNASNMKLLSNDSEEPEYDTVIDIPSAQLAFNDDGSIVGAFGATYTPVAMMLPYEGEFRFYLDPSEGYFYVQIAGSFKYFVTFRGEVFIVHAPYEKLLNPPPFFNVPVLNIPSVTSIIEDLSRRALFPSDDDFYAFKNTVGFDGLSDDTIVTGFFTAGNAQAGVDVIDGVLSLNIASGPGIYAFIYNGGDSGYSAGTFLNTRASADILLLSLYARNMLKGGITPGEFSVGGDFEIGACADAFLAHCEAGINGSVEFSSNSGFDFSGSGAWAHCDFGGCN